MFIIFFLNLVEIMLIGYAKFPLFKPVKKVNNDHK